MYSSTSTSTLVKGKIKALEKELTVSYGLKAAEILQEIGDSYDSLSKEKISIFNSSEASKAFLKAADIYRDSENYTKEIRLLKKAASSLGRVYGNEHAELVAVRCRIELAQAANVRKRKSVSGLSEGSSSSKSVSVKRSASNVTPGRRSVSALSTASSSSKSVPVRKGSSVAPAAKEHLSVTFASFSDDSAERKSATSPIRDKALIALAQNGSTADVKKLIEYEGFIPSEECKSEFMDIADTSGRASLGGLAVEQGVDPKSCGKGDCAYIHSAIKNGNFDLVETFIRKDISLLKFPDQNGDISIHLAIEHKHFKLVELLIETDISLLDFLGQNDNKPIHLAAQGDYLYVVELLIKNGAELNSSNKDGNKPIHLAAQRGSHNITELLVKEKVKLNSSNNDGNKPIHLAAQGGFCNIAELLIKNGAELNSSNNDGNRPIHLAVHSLATVMALVEGGADFDLPNNDDKKPIDLAIYGSVEFKYLQEKGRSLERKKESLSKSRPESSLDDVGMSRGNVQLQK